MSVNDIQIGGSHYRSSLQHWDMIELHGIGYLEAAATKYITRWRKKNGLQDLEKSLHYIDKLIELHGQGKRLPRGVAPMTVCAHFASANGLCSTEQRACTLLFRWEERHHLEAAKVEIHKLIDEARAQQP